MDLDDFTRSVTTLFSDDDVDPGMAVPPQAEAHIYSADFGCDKLETRLALFSETLQQVSVAQILAIYAIIEGTLLDDQRQLLANGQVVDFDLSRLVLNDESWNQMMMISS